MQTTLIALAVTAVGLNYPVAKKVDVVDDYHGVKVADPYRWLEQPIDDPEVRQWVDAENKVTDDYFAQIPGRDRLFKELQRRVNYERFGIPTEAKGALFYERNDGLQNQNTLYAQRSGKATVLLDPNKLSKDGTSSLNEKDFSLDGSTMLYGISVGGSDWVEWRIRDTKTGKDRPDVVKWSKFGGGVLNGDGTGFYYLRFPEPKQGEELTAANTAGAIYYHKIGTEQQDDELVLKIDQHPDWFVFPIMDPDRKTLFIYIDTPGSTNNKIWAKDLTKKDAPIRKIFDSNDALWSPIAREGDWLYTLTSRNAPKNKVVAVSLTDPSKVKVIVPESKNLLQSASVIDRRLVLSYLRDAHAEVEVADMQGKNRKKIQLPGLGTVDGFAGRPGDRHTFFSYVDFYSPLTIYKLQPTTGKVTLWKKPKVAIDTSKYEARQVFYRSKDGTRVPMFIVHRKGLKLDGTNPTYLYGYGGFNVSQLPWFSTSRTAWMDMGGVWCLANIRGGGEYGKDWWESAIKSKRQNAYDDFIAAAEWLIDNHYTSKKRLAINGGSNGGLLVGACMVQRPDLFQVCVPEVGVMDLLRFNQFTIGKGWEGDYGSPQNPKDFPSILKISPYHNLKKANYPATLVMTADRDDRVVPAHSFKFAARLQEMQTGNAPVLLRVETTSGHGSSNLTKSLEGVRDIYAFILHNMGLKIPEKF